MPAATSSRLFFAAWPDASVRERLATLAGRLKREYPARWVRPSRYHLTLAFLGGMPPSRIERAMRAASGVHAPALVWHPDRITGFRAARPPCVLCAGTPDTALQRLHRALLDALAAHDVHVAERQPYAPHITLGYGRGGVIAERKLPAPDVPIRSFVLLHSVPGEDEYRELGRWPLEAS